MLFITCAAHAVPDPIPENDDSQMRAKQEIAQPGRANNKSTNAQVAGDTGMLSLEDPLEKMRKRQFDFYVKLAVQSFQPMGEARNDYSTTTFKLDETSNMAMPGLTTGFRAKLPTFFGMNWRWGVGARIAYATGKGNGRFDTGFEESSVRLNTLSLSGIPEIAFGVSTLPSWTVGAGLELGTLSYTQTSGNKLASFSDRVNYAGVITSVEYAFNSKWSALFAYTRRAATKSSDLEIQANNFELGTRLSW